MIRKRADERYEVFSGKSNLPTGDVIKDDVGWVFWPSVYRRPIDLKTAGEILTLLQELEDALSK